MANRSLAVSVNPLRASAAFFSFLRANLVLSPPTTSSNNSTPLLDPSLRSSSPQLQTSLASLTAADGSSNSGSSLGQASHSRATVLTSKPHRDAALELVADSIAQQWPQAAWELSLHPFIIGAYLFMVGITTRFMFKEWTGLLFIPITAITFVCLVAVLVAAHGYSRLANDFIEDYAMNEDGQQDVIIGTCMGEKIIGAAILRLERACCGSGKKKNKGGKPGGKGLVRAWTTKKGYRGKGIGKEMLEEAVRVTRERLGNSSEIGFAAEHANSQIVLPKTFNGGFRRTEARAARALDAVVSNVDGGSKKKRKRGSSISC